MNLSILSKPLRLSTNPAMINKNEGGDKSLFSSGWINCSLTPSELAASIDRGEAFTCELSGTRKRANFVCAEVLAVDMDGNLTIEDALAEPFAQKHLTIFYTTPSHTEAEPRFRLVFALPRPITDTREMEAATRSLILRFGGDRAAKDAARIFYGSRGSRPKVYDRAIHDDVLNELIKQGLDADQHGSDGNRISTVSRLALAADRVVITSEGQAMPFAEIGYGTSVHCPFHHDKHASAYVVKSSDGTTLGLYCSTCDQSFWPTKTTFDGDFSDFDKRIAEAAAYYENRKDIGPFQPALTASGAVHHPGLETAKISRQQNQYIELPADLPEGLVLIKSPKGTGKTEHLEALLKRDQRSALLVGHRIALISQSCERLGLDCYRDFEGELKSRRLGVCLDSLGRIPVPSLNQRGFDTIIIDESEQVIAHFLSETMNEKRNEVFHGLTALLRKAKRVIALDADLGWVTFDVLSKMSDATQVKGSPKDISVFVNERKVASDVDIYSSREHLIDELKAALSHGRRCYVTSNSLGLMEKLHHAFGQNDIRSILITSQTTSKAEVKAFIAEPAEEAMQYDVVFASPTIGTGVDITFPEDEKRFDVVFGFFEAGITTHLDFDQQLWRVRHPGAVKVWVSPRRFNFDTAIDVVKREIQQKNLFKSVLKGYDENFRPVYHVDDPLIDLAALVRSQQLASKNNLKNCFVAMKRRHGHKINFIDRDNSASANGTALLKAGALAALDSYADQLLSVPTLSRSNLEEIEEAIQDNSATETDRASYTRTFIELFYRAPLSKDLIGQDDKGRLRAKIERFETVVSVDEDIHFEKVLKNFAEYGSQRARFLRDKRVAGRLLADLLKAANVFDGKAFLREAKFNEQDLAQFKAMLVKLKPQVETQLDVEVASGATGIRQLKALLKLVGIETERCGSTKAKNVAGGKKVYLYSLDLQSLDFVESIRNRRKKIGGWKFLAAHYGVNPKPPSDEFDHPPLGLGLSLDIPLRDPKVGVAGEQLHVPERAPDRCDLPGGVRDEGPTPGVA